MVTLMLLLGCTTPVAIPGFDATNLASKTRWLEACQAGEAMACHFAAHYCLDGGDGPRDLKCVQDAMTRECVRGDARACTTLGAAMTSLGGDIDEGLRLLEASCAKDAEQCREWAWALRRRDPAKAREIVAKTCADGVRSGCDDAAVIGLVDGDVTQPELEAARVACVEHHDRATCTALAEVMIEDLDQGTDGMKLLDAGCLMWRRRGLHDDSQGCTLAAWYTLRHSPRPYDEWADTHIVVSLRQGCDDGDAEACFGLWYVKTHPDLGIELIERETPEYLLARACGLGMPEACGDPALLPDPMKLKSGWDGGFRRGP